MTKRANPQEKRDLGITPETRSRLVRLVGELVADCVDWYRDDAEVLEQMTDADLKTTVRDYLSKRAFYREPPTNGENL